MVDPAADDFQSSQEGEVDGHTHSHVSLGYGMDGNPDFQNLIPPPQTRLNIVKTNIGSMQKADIEILESGISIYIAPDLLTNPSRVLFKFLYISVKRISFRPSSIFFLLILFGIFKLLHQESRFGFQSTTVETNKMVANLPLVKEKNICHFDYIRVICEAVIRIKSARCAEVL